MKPRSPKTPGLLLVNAGNYLGRGAAAAVRGRVVLYLSAGPPRSLFQTTAPAQLPLRRGFLDYHPWPLALGTHFLLKLTNRPDEFVRWMPFA